MKRKRELEEDDPRRIARDLTPIEPPIYTGAGVKKNCPDLTKKNEHWQISM